MLGNLQCHESALISEGTCSNNSDGVVREVPNFTELEIQYHLIGIQICELSEASEIWRVDFVDQVILSVAEFMKSRTNR